jgi:hypothetical protein
MAGYGGGYVGSQRIVAGTPIQQYSEARAATSLLVAIMRGRRC